MSNRYCDNCERVRVDNPFDDYCEDCLKFIKDYWNKVVNKLDFSYKERQKKKAEKIMTRIKILQNIEEELQKYIDNFPAEDEALEHVERAMGSIDDAINEVENEDD